MNYRMLLWPHANARYQSESIGLARAELRLMLDRLAPDAGIDVCDETDMPWLDIRFPAAPDADVIEALRGHSLMYGLFEDRGGLLAPVAGRAKARVGRDLPAILKYKGKTNEMFLQLLINAALYSGDYWPRRGEALSLLDPMCGRATSLFVAANLGWNATGADVDRGDLNEAEKYFKRYLEYHRFKHSVSRGSRTMKRGGSAPECRFEYAPDAASMREGCAPELSLIHLDASRCGEALGKNTCHVIVCDLPYGVRHDAQLARGEAVRGNWLEALLERSLPGWGAALKPGGTVALSFNAQNVKTELVRQKMQDAGMEVMRGGAWDGFSHWVEQAITRDIAICKKTH